MRDVTTLIRRLDQEFEGDVKDQKAAWEAITAK
jgi:hypothetical protein